MCRSIPTPDRYGNLPDYFLNLFVLVVLNYFISRLDKGFNRISVAIKQQANTLPYISSDTARIVLVRIEELDRKSLEPASPTYNILDLHRLQPVSFFDRLHRVTGVVLHPQRLVKLGQPEQDTLESGIFDPCIARTPEKISRLRSRCFVEPAAQDQDGVRRFNVVLQIGPCDRLVDPLRVHDPHFNIAGVADQMFI